nr:oligosaccharide flippase family protein [Streptococcus uberis]
MSSNSLKKNLGYQSIYQILITFLPLITSPYLARVLGVSSLGLFSYTQSIANYFVLFAGLGVANYGTRAIADVKDDVEKRSKTFF